MPTMSMVMLELFYSNVKQFHVCISKFNFPVTNELFVYQTRLISDFCTSLCNIMGNSHVTFFAFIDVLQFKEVIACKNIDYAQRILLSRYFNGFFNVWRCSFRFKLHFLHFCSRRYIFDMSYKVLKTMNYQ